MFTRNHRVGRHLYTEALESYRDPETGRPRHRCIARWRADRSLAVELGETRRAIASAEGNLAHYQERVARRTHPLFPPRPADVRAVAEWQRQLTARTAHHAALTRAREMGVAADDAEIEEAARAAKARSDAVIASFSRLGGPDMASLAAKARRLMTENDPDVVRAGLDELAEALDRG
jgi:hypothetical protein